jgi:2-(1,2-epoxy-1,2-dihydrophenyl)acetyl-CoA isomerase
MSDEVKSWKNGAVGHVVLNRPDQLNAMNDALLDSLVDKLEDFSHDRAVGVVVLTGAGRAFCAGGDLSAMAEAFKTATPAGETAKLRRHARAAELLRTMPAVTIAAVNGACAGAGLGLALAADLRLVSGSAVFKTAFLSAAMSGDFGTAWSLTRLLGEARARELYFLNEKIDADSAVRLGLASRVVANEGFADEVDRVARSIAGSAPLARERMKENLNEAYRLDLSEAIARESVRHVSCGFSQDAAEAGAAFLERRTPVFAGR